MLRTLFQFLSACALMSCASPQTAVIVTIDADAELRESALTVVVERADGERRPVTLGDGWPHSFTVVPTGGDASRTFTIEASVGALPLTRVRSGFVLGQVRHVRVHFDAGCGVVTCDGGATACPGTCESACGVACGGETDAGMDASLDADVSDAGDAGLEDTNTGPDAGDAGPAGRTGGASLAYDFAETGGGFARTCDASTSEYDLTVAGIVTQDTSGLRLAGLADVEVDLGTPAELGASDLGCWLLDPETPTCGGARGFTIELWVTPDAIVGRPYETAASMRDDFRPPSLPDHEAALLDIAAAGSLAPEVRGVLLGVSTTIVYESVYSIECAHQNARPIFAVGEGLTGGAPAHVVIVRTFLDAEVDLATEQIFVNGVEAAPIYTYRPVTPGTACETVTAGQRPGWWPTFPSPAAPSPYVLRLGSSPGTDRTTSDYPQHFEGTYHLLAIYDRPLGPDEVRDNFEAGHDADPCTGP